MLLKVDLHRYDFQCTVRILGDSCAKNNIFFSKHLIHENSADGLQKHVLKLSI